MDNNSTWDGDNLSQWERVSFAVVISIMAVTAVIGNCLVCLTLHRFKMPASVFIINLAFSDIIIGGWVMPFCVVTLLEGHWIFGPVMCHVVAFVKTACLFSSALTLCVIAADRYIIIKNVARGSEVVYKTTVFKTAIGLLVPWTVSSLTAMGPLLGWGDYKWVPIKPTCTVDWLQSPSYSLVCFITYAFVLDIFMSCCYLGIAREVHRKKSRIQNAVVDARASINPPVKVNNGRAVSREEMGVLKTTMVVVFMFTIMSVPYVTMQLISIKRNKEFSLRAETITTTLLFLGSCINPLIYSGANKKFRLALKKTIRGLIKCC
ncbi:rhodopsin, GQ-coupled-like [Asterias amurensis]|uniref:rhodopsin, GQ-coupled-like n=1 Tax=Asterias amurensis TaxID=7602 RepID=UPI003AB3633C